MIGAQARVIVPSRGWMKIRCEAASRTTVFRSALSKPGILLGPCCHDGLSAKLIERAGFPLAFMSGFTTTSAKLGAPDVGLISYAEMVQTGRDIHEATHHIPIVGDADTGYGGPWNVKRTVEGYADAGFAGILIEDQVWPKSCGHVKGKKVISRLEAVQRIVAAVEARDAYKDILIFARTDARQAESLEEAMFRVQAFADAGADVLFVDAIESEAEMEQFCSVVPSVPKMAAMLEGGGKTPMLSPRHLEEMGFKIVAYPLSLMGVSIDAMEQALRGLQTGQIPDISFRHIQEIVGFNHYFTEIDRLENKAKTTLDDAYIRSMSSRTPTKDTGAAPQETEGPQRTPEEGDTTPSVEADDVLNEASVMMDAVVVEASNEDEQNDQWFPSFARIRVQNAQTSEVKMEFKIPVGFLEGASQFVPALKDMDLRSFVTRERFPNGQPIIQFTDDDDHVEVFLE